MFALVGGGFEMADGLAWLKKMGKYMVYEKQASMMGP